MKALSIKQPWASLIAHGIKDIENRTWATKYRGKVLIHASCTWFKYPNSDSTLGDLFTDFQWEKIRENYDKNLYSILEPKAIIDRLPTSAIIGEVDIIDCVINHPSIWAEKSDNYGRFQKNGIPAYVGKKENKPIYNWVLANPILYEKPILNVKGKLSFWEFEK